MTADERVKALEREGYTEREAQFLALVAVHGGHFLRRQFEAYADLRRGGTASRFLGRAASQGHIRSAQCANHTEIFHLFARRLYRAIGQEDNRNRRSRPHLSIKARLMALDFVLGRRDCRFLATEHEKLKYFVGDRRISCDRLPGKTYTARSSGATTRRYFIEKHPIYFESDDGSRVPSFCYIDDGALSTSGFTSFLNRYRPLFASLRRFRFTYVAAEHRPFRRALGVFERFETSLDHPEDRLPAGLLGDYFRLRYHLESRQYHLLDKAKLDRLRTLADRFQHPSAEKKFREWADEMAAARSSEPIEAGFELYRLYHRYDIF